MNGIPGEVSVGSAVRPSEIPVGGAVLDEIRRREVVGSGTDRDALVSVLRGFDTHFLHEMDGIRAVAASIGKVLVPTYDRVLGKRRTDPGYGVSLEEVGRLSSAIWPGKVSLAARLEAGEVSSDEVAAAQGIIPLMYVDASGGAPMRCPDPRILKGFNPTDIDHVLRELGPQVIGGTLGSALTRRLAIGGVMQELADQGRAVTISDDVRWMHRIENETGFQPGDHFHDEAPVDKIGCKAVDDAVHNLEILGNGGLMPEVDSLTEAILGPNTFSRSSMSHVRGSAAEMVGVADRYLATLSSTVEDMRSNDPGSFEILTGPNTASFVVVNFVPGTTFAKDTYNALTDNRLQVINYDFWRSRGVAEVLAATHSTGVVDSGIRSSFLHARVAYTIATLMNMLDGSQQLFRRVPNSFDVARAL